MRRLALLAAVLAAASGLSLTPGCAGPRLAAGDALLDVWAGLDETAREAEGQGPEWCDEAFGTWFTSFGVRGLACLAGHVQPLSGLAGRAPVAPFVRGPHEVSADAVRLSLRAPRDFGHYDPAFVRWLAGAAVPRAPEAVALTQPAYHRHVQRLARVYWLAQQDLSGAGGAADAPAQYAAFLRGAPAPEAHRGPDGGFSMLAFTERSEALAGRTGLPVENPWEVVYEANTAYGFWLRRRVDGTDAPWREGLRTLLARYDGAWLGAHGG